MQRLWLIAYDIVDDRTRNRVDRALQAHGVRVQWSVFEAFLTPEEQRQLARELNMLIDREEDSIRFYPLCAWCQQDVGWHGQGRRTDDPATIVI